MFVHAARPRIALAQLLSRQAVCRVELIALALEKQTGKLGAFAAPRLVGDPLVPVGSGRLPRWTLDSVGHRRLLDLARLHRGSQTGGRNNHRRNYGRRITAKPRHCPAGSKREAQGCQQ